MSGSSILKKWTDFYQRSLHWEKRRREVFLKRSKMDLVGQLLIYFGVGFLEMFLATQRTYWISKGKSLGAALLVFFENFIAIFIIYQVANNLSGNWPVFISYALGNAIGTYINLEKVPF